MREWHRRWSRTTVIKSWHMDDGHEHQWAVRGPARRYCDCADKIRGGSGDAGEAGMAGSLSEGVSLGVADRLNADRNICILREAAWGMAGCREARGDVAQAGEGYFLQCAITLPECKNPAVHPAGPSKTSRWLAVCHLQGLPLEELSWKSSYQIATA